MADQTINLNMVQSISIFSGQTLTVLDLTFSKGLTPNMIQQLFTNCVELIEVCLCCAHISKKAIYCLVQTLRPKVEKLDLNGVGDSRFLLNKQSLVQKSI